MGCWASAISIEQLYKNYSHWYFDVDSIVIVTYTSFAHYSKNGRVYLNGSMCKIPMLIIDKENIPRKVDLYELYALRLDGYAPPHNAHRFQLKITADGHSYKYI
jgi:hypothetical protein